MAGGYDLPYSNAGDGAVVCQHECCNPQRDGRLRRGAGQGAVGRNGLPGDHGDRHAVEQLAGGGDGHPHDLHVVDRVVFGRLSYGGLRQ